jgi:hypothetical protein
VRSGYRDLAKNVRISNLNSLFWRIKPLYRTANAVNFSNYGRTLKFHGLCALRGEWKITSNSETAFFAKSFPLCSFERMLQIAVCRSSCMTSPLYYGLASWQVITQICLLKRYCIEIRFKYLFTHTCVERNGEKDMK